jgi:hypothetical protein
MSGMTDREALEELLRRFGLTPSDHTGDSHGPDPEANQVILEAQVGGVKGYSGFCAAFNFDADGKFESLAIWE